MKLGVVPNMVKNYLENNQPNTIIRFKKMAA